MAGIGRFIISVIASFARAHHTITAAIDTAVGLAGILIDGVAIVAGLITFIVFRQAPSEHAIAAAR